MSEADYKYFIDNLRKCPRCGEYQPCNRKDDVGVYIHCHACKYETHSHPILLDAVEEWNKTRGKEINQKARSRP